ncbi:hypothetical protein BaRGS_00018695 [Batillaria attramentaria]|uniref:Uncharacterized protein n=1 Tax=Batillaria attramentaria TaxID=370345 RepID=A0ABD0KS83_9CAEN
MGYLSCRANAAHTLVNQVLTELDTRMRMSIYVRCSWTKVYNFHWLQNITRISTGHKNLNHAFTPVAAGLTQNRQIVCDVFSPDHWVTGNGVRND